MLVPFHMLNRLVWLMAPVWKVPIWNMFIITEGCGGQCYSRAAWVQTWHEDQ